jgi:serine protease Do
MSPEQAEGLYQAQVTWDAAMGWNAGKALATPADPKEIVVVLIGSGHVAYGLGAERQLAPSFRGRIASLIPVTVRDVDGKPVPSVSAGYANFLWGVPWTAQPTEPVLGVSLMGRMGKEPSTVIQIDAGSTAEQAGIKLGDVLRELDGTKIDGTTALQRKTGDYRWGDGAKLLIERAGQAQTLDIIFRRRG